MQGIPTLKVFGAAALRKQTLITATRGMRAASMSLLRAELAAAQPGRLMTVAGLVLTGGIAAIRLAQGALDARELLLVLILARECFRPVDELKLALHLSYKGVSGAERILDILDAEPLVTDTGTETPSLAVPSVRFEDVSFRYPTGSTPALSQLSFEVGPGEHVAIVGRSGAGKSTVIALLMRFFDPSAGRVVIDGHDARDLDLVHYRGQFSLVSQDTYLFHGTVRENLLLARPEAGDAELRQACAAANALEFIDELPEGLDTMIGERGVRLSGAHSSGKAWTSSTSAMRKEAAFLMRVMP